MDNSFMDRLEHALNWKPKPKPTGKERPGFIYFIQCHDFIKVGYAENVPVRLIALQTGCPYELKLIKSIKTDDVEGDERKVHQHWKRYEIRGEWFQVPEGELLVLAGSETIDELVGL